MANVARAIEQAAEQKVCAELWWDSFASLFHILDKSGAAQGNGEPHEDLDVGRSRHSETLNVLVEKLRANEKWLLNTLACFKPPNPTSRAALGSPHVIVGNHRLEIKSGWKDVALQVSKHLVLDEVQAYIVLSRILEFEDAPVTADKELLHSVGMAYFLERQCLLKCLRLLLAFQMAAQGEAATFSSIINEEVRTLLSQNLDHTVTNVLKDQLMATQPQHLEREYADLWAEEMALEQTLLLDILFLLYYEPLCICTSHQLQELVRVFQESIFESTVGERLSVTPEAERYVQHVRHQAVLILLEALDLENVLLMVHGEVPFSQGGHSFSVEDLGRLDRIMSGLDFGSVPDYAPLLLGWGVFICLVTYLPVAHGAPATPEIDHTQYVRQAYQAGAYSFLLDLLQSELSKESDVQGSGYKNVVKTLIAALLAAYDFAGQMDFDGFDSLVEILCEVYRGQEALCLEFWDRESVIDGPIRSVLFSLRDSFPYRAVPLIRLLAALCDGTWPAECVYDFLYKMVQITSLYQHHEGFLEREMTSEDRNRICTSTALQIPDAPGLLIPAGTCGRVLRDTDSGICLVRWECLHSGILVLLLRILHRSTSTDDLEEVEASLNLFNRMLFSNKGLAQLMLELNTSVATRTSRERGVMEPSLRIDIVSMICSVISNLVQNVGDDRLIASCIGILSTFSLCCSSQVVTELSRSSLLQPCATKLSLSVGGLFSGTLLQALLLKTEQTVGQYPLTVAVLDLSIILLERGVLSESVASLVMHVVRNLLVNHGNWRYQQRHERWQITTKGFQIVQNVLSGIIWLPESRKFELSVLDSVLYDGIIHDVLLQLLSISSQALEELHFNRMVRPKELEWVQHAIYVVLMLLHQVVLHITVGIGAKDHTGFSTLEHTLFHRSAGLMPVVASVASYLDFPRNMDLQLASTKALTSLCISAQKARPYPTSIATYILAEQRKALRAMVAKLLSEENAFSNFQLFEAVTDFLVTAVRTQPALVEFLLFPWEDFKGRPNTAAIRRLSLSLQTDRAPDMPSSGRSEVLDILWIYLTKATALIQSHPEVLSRVLFLLASFWQGGMEYFRVVEDLRNRDSFWKRLAACVSFNNSTGDSNTLLCKLNTMGSGEHNKLRFSKQDMFTYAHLYRSEATVFTILAHDIFLQKHLIYAADSKTEGAGGPPNAPAKPFTVKESGALEIIQEWRGFLKSKDVLHAYTAALFDRDVLWRAKAETRVMVVGLMGKVISGHDRGLSSALVGRIRHATMQVLELPSFVELLGQYSARGYSYGEQLQTMLISDLYHHLQGELEGRPIPAGPFQQIAEFIKKNEIDVLLKPKTELQIPDTHPAYGDCFFYNTTALEAELGYEWWSDVHQPQIITPAEADSTLRSMRRANGMAALGDAQLAALKSIGMLLTVSVFDQQVTRTGSALPNQGWTDGDIESGIEALTKNMEAAVAAVAPDGDSAGYFASFLATQAEFLLALVQWLCNRNACSPPTSHECLRLCVKIVRSVVTCLRSVLGSQSFLESPEGLVKSLLGAFAMALELIYMSGKEDVTVKTQGSHSRGDVFADVALVGLGFLPVLCAAAQNEAYATLAVAAINMLIKGFLAPPRWFPILQRDFPLQLALSRMRLDTGTEFSRVMLNLCLSLSCVRSGGELLVTSGFFSHFMQLSQQLQAAAHSSTDMEGPFAVWQKHKRQQEGLWAFGVSVVTALLRSCADDDIAEKALTYLAYEKDRMLSALRAPISSMDSQGRKKAKLQHPHTSLAALQQTQRIVALICELSNHHAPWVRFSEDSVLQFGDMAVHLLAFIAKEGFTRPGGPRVDASVSCHPLQKEEKAAHSRPCIIGSNCAWFAVAAKGCTVGDKQLARSSGSRSPSPTKLSSPIRLSNSPSSSATMLAKTYGSAGTQFPCTEYSDMVAISVYKLAALLLGFLCKQVQRAVSRVPTGGPPDFLHFPELPAPDILHNLQDQAMAVIIDVCNSRAGSTLDARLQDFCCLLMGILEKSLCLEICLWRTCDITPLPLRSDDFAREYKALVTGVEAHQALDGPLTSLKRIISVAHPGIS